MKKKIISGLLVAAIIGGGAVSMTSCKDNTDDLYTELTGKQVELSTRLDILADQLIQCSNACNQKISDLQNDLANNYYTKTEIDAKLAELNNLYAQKATVDQLVTAMQGLQASGVTSLDKATVDALISLAGMKDDLSAVTGLASNVAALNALAEKKDELLALLNGGSTGGGTVEIPDLTDLNNAVFGTADSDGKLTGGLLDRVSGLEGYFTLEDGSVISIADFQTALNNGLWLNEYKQAIEDMTSHLKNADGSINTDALDALTSYYEKFDKFNAMYDTLFPGVTVNEDGTLSLPDGLTEWWSYADVINNIIKNQEDINVLKGNISALFQRFDDLVTSLILQATNNPVFGGVNSPFGVNSMILMSYFGKASSDIDFPLEDSEDAGLKGNVWNNVPIPSEVYGGTLYDDSFGKLYFTVNPVGANVNADGFSIENSKSVKSPVNITVTPSDEELRFGYSRSEDNGFYEANVSLNATPANAETSLNQIKIHVTDGLTSALKDVVNNRKLSDVASLAKTVLTNVSDLCTANALRYDWTTTSADNKTVNNSVLSQYGLAVTAFKPLSFTTLRDVNVTNRKLPIIGSIEIDKSLLDFKIDKFSVGDVSLNLAISIQAIQFDALGEQVVTVKVPAKFDTKVDKTTGEVETYLPDGWQDMEGYYEVMTVNINDQLQSVVDQMQKAVNDWVKGNGVDGGLEAQINNAIDSAVKDAFNGDNGLIAKIESQVNDMIGSVEDKLYDLIDAINGSRYMSLLNRLVSYYNRAANAINARINDPNHYLQVTMLYKTSSGGINYLSNSSNDYTYFKYKGGDGINLYATTYNLELLAPVYKKFVAVTDVKVDGVSKPELVATANSASNMATILSGKSKAVTLTTKGIVESGHTYAFEVTYRALDYQGTTSTARYYIVVDAK